MITLYRIPSKNEMQDKIQLNKKLGQTKKMDD